MSRYRTEILALEPQEDEHGHLTFEYKGYRATCIAKTAHPFGGPPLTTVMCVYPRVVHDQMLTHRVFSRNASSNRAIPTDRMIASVSENPAMPPAWLSAKKGMVGGEPLDEVTSRVAESVWRGAARSMADAAETLMGLGVHQQDANRLLLPFQWVSALYSSTEWENFFGLRCEDDAQPQVEITALLMHRAVCESKASDTGGVHRPFGDRLPEADTLVQLMVTVARACRVSYDQAEGDYSLERDVRLCQRELRACHMSPFEHSALAVAPFHRPWHSVPGNFLGWHQLRHNSTLLQQIRDYEVPR